MVTVPALGAEWGKDEMYQMTKTGRKERKHETRKDFWKAWNRGERGLCGRYFTRKVLVWFLFGLCCVWVPRLSVGRYERLMCIQRRRYPRLYDSPGAWR